jgi:hypothetical protein
MDGSFKKIIIILQVAVKYTFGPSEKLINSCNVSLTANKC